MICKGFPDRQNKSKQGWEGDWKVCDLCGSIRHRGIVKTGCHGRIAIRPGLEIAGITFE
jgi:hypothetical protein